MWSKLLALGVLMSTASLACAPQDGPTATLDSISALGDIRLADGRTVRLAGLMWPGRERPRERQRLVAAMSALLSSEALHVMPRGDVDRWGRLPADIFVGTGTGQRWLQGDLLEDGLARAWPESAARPCWSSLTEREFLARQPALGIWSALAMRPVQRQLRDGSRAPISGRVIYIGRVVSVRQGRTVTFVNFAGPRRTTPSWLVDRRLQAELVRQGRDPATFTGQRLLLRADYVALPRPTLRATLPEAVEILE